MADESPTNSALSSDRGLPLGNSAGTGGRRRLHVFVDQNSTPIPVTDPVQWDTIIPTHPDDFTTVWTYTLSAVVTQVITLVYPDLCHTGDPTITKVIP